MADALILRAEPRDVHGKKVRRLRREGLVPGVVYGPVIEGTVSVSVNRREFERFYNQAGHSTVFNLEWEGGSQPVLIREVQIDPITRSQLHIDFFAPNMQVTLRQTVPVVLQHLGDHDGVLQNILNEVEVEALPSDLPHQIEVDAAPLRHVGDSLYIRDLTAPANVTIITGGDELIASLIAEAVEAAPEDETAEGEEPAAAEGTEEPGEDSSDE